MLPSQDQQKKSVKYLQNLAEAKLKRNANTNNRKVKLLDGMTALGNDYTPTDTDGKDMYKYVQLVCFECSLSLPCFWECVQTVKVNINDMTIIIVIVMKQQLLTSILFTAIAVVFYDSSCLTSAVICARGKIAVDHKGNKRFKEIVMASLPKYRDAATKLGKSVIVSEIVDIIRRAR